MKYLCQPGLSNLEVRAVQLAEMSDPLAGLNASIDCEAFRFDPNRVHEEDRKNMAGASQFDVVLLFKVLVLQQLHNHSDDKIKYPILDRCCFMCFLVYSFRIEYPVSI